MHEHIARAIYYFSVHLLYASVVGAAAWALTSIRGPSATTKYWIWVITAFSFIVPVGAVVDRFWASHFTWATPLAAIGGPIWHMTRGKIAAMLAALWTSGAAAMFLRLIVRLRRECREDQATGSVCNHGATASFVADGIPVSFAARHPTPAVTGIFHPRILLPIDMDRLLNQREFDAVLLHELAHARRRDNLIRILYELSLCVLWFHPLIWLAGARMALYRELSCDEAVLEVAHGTDLVSALAKLAVPEQTLSLQATAFSHMSHRLAWLVGPPQAAQRIASVLLASVFSAVVVACVFATVAHTACCFVLK